MLYTYIYVNAKNFSSKVLSKCLPEIRGGAYAGGMVGCGWRRWRRTRGFQNLYIIYLVIWSVIIDVLLLFSCFQLKILAENRTIEGNNSRFFHTSACDTTLRITFIL